MLLLGTFFASLLVSDSTSAFTLAETERSIMDKAVYQGIENCYNNGSIVDKFNSLSDYTGVGSFLTGKAQSGNPIPLITGSITGGVLGNTSGYNVKDGGLTCSELYQGGFYLFGGSNSKITKAMGVTEPELENAESVITFLENMGYYVNRNNDTCYSIAVTGGEAYGSKIKQTSTNAVCMDGNGNLYSDNQTMGGISIGFEAKNGNEVCLKMLNNSNIMADRGCKQLGNTQFSAEWLNSVVSASPNCDGNVCTSEAGITYTLGGSAEQGTGLKKSSARFLGNNPTTASMQAIRYLSNDDKYQTTNDLAFTPIEKRVLYQNYLTNYYGVTVDCSNNSNASSSNNAITWFDTSDNTIKTCTYNTSGAKNTGNQEGVNGIDGSGMLSWQSIKNMDGLISEIGTLPKSYSDAEIKDFVETVTISNSRENNNYTEGQTEQSNPKANCFNSGAAGALGWVLCPIMDAIGDATTFVYEKMVAPNLNIEPTLFSDDENYGTRQGWSIFQGIANVLIIVLFLAVIFSQLTGVGIDNYGIKRILPKIILVAILMNLSYYICLILVDVSNIAGNGITGLFNSLSTNVPSSTEYANVLGQVGTTITSVALLGGIVWGTASGLIVVDAIGTLLAILPVAVSLIISLFFTFIILSARQAAVVVMVVISPLAFACYMLPNTKRWFDRWVKVLQALLLVYPICSLMVAGGDYVSRLLLSSGFADSTTRALVAMLAGIVPIFFIPSVLKNSLNGLGNLGNRISNLGSRLSGGAANRIRNSEMYKFQQQQAQERKGQKLAGLHRDENGKWVRDNNLRNRITESRLGQAAGLDRLRGRRRNQVVAAQYSADTERDNDRLDIENAQQYKNDEFRANRSGEAIAYERLMGARTAAERAAMLAEYEKYSGQNTTNKIIESEERAREGAAITNREYARDTANLERLRQQGRINAGAVRTNLDYETQLATNERRMQQGKVNEGAPVVSDRYARRMAENARTNEQAKIDNVAPRVTQAYANQLAANEAMREAARIRAGAPELQWDTVSTIAGNEVRMTNAQQAVGVSEINEELATARATASFKAQELRNSSDMYNTFAQSKLLSEAGFQLDASGKIMRNPSTGQAIIDTNKLRNMINEKGGAQRFIALTQTMTSKGLENQMFDVMMNQDVASILASNSENDLDVRSAFTSSPEKIAKAWGKTGAGMSMYDFVNKMQTYTDNNGNKVEMTALQKYMSGKGAQEFFTNITDKSLGVIETAQKNADFDIIKTPDMMQGLEIVKEQSAVSSMVNMIKNRDDLTMSGEQLTRVAPSVISEFATTPQGQRALIQASNDIIGDRDRMNKIKNAERVIIDKIRTDNGLDPIWSNISSSGTNQSGSGNQTGNSSASKQFNTMSSQDLMQRATMTRPTDADLEQLNQAMLSRDDLSMTGEQLTSLPESTIRALLGSPNPKHQSMLLAASDEIASNPALASRLDAKAGIKGMLNSLRLGRLDTTDPSMHKAL